MKTVICSATLAIFCAASAIGITSCATKPAPETNVSSGAKTTTKNYYTCAMHPQIHSQDPEGKCPICGMPLVPASEVPDEQMNQ